MEFETPYEYACHLLTKMSKSDAIAHVLRTHGDKGSFWRQTLEYLRNARSSA